MTLSKRLQAVADMVTPGLVVADIGTDHGYIPIYLTQKGIAPSAYAMDINKGPLERATEHVKAENLQEKIQTIQSNGMEKLKNGMVQSVVIAGMGGELITKIIEQSPVLETLEELVLSPHSEIDHVRNYMLQYHWKIIDETMVKDNDKYYTIMKLIPREEQEIYTEEELRYGRCLIRKQSSIFVEYLDKEYNKYRNILKRLDESPNGAKRNEEVLRLCEMNRKVRGADG